MRRILVVGLLSALFWSVGPTVSTGSESAVLIYVRVPADAKVTVDGVAVKQTGPERRLITPKLKEGTKAQYVITATFYHGGKPVTIERTITVEPGKETIVDFTPGSATLPNPKKTDPKKEEPKKADPKKEEPKKADPKKEEPKKVDPKKEEPKKAEPKKEEPKKADPKKEEPKKAEPKKTEPKKDEPKKEVELDVPYVPTPTKVVDAMLKTAGVKEGDVVYDLGCGDGRIVITAVKEFKAKKGVGVELAPERVKLSRVNAKSAGVESKVEIREGDVLKIRDLSEADVVCLYLLPEVNEKLKPILRKTLKPGARIVSHDFDMGDDWMPEKELVVKGDTRDHTVYLWTIPPAKKAEPKKTVEPKKADPKTPAKVGPEPKKDAPKIPETIRVPYVPTPDDVVVEMLKVAGVQKGDVVFDLGCGDGRIVVTAVKKFGAKKGYGVDIDPERIKDSEKTAKDAGVTDKVKFERGDVLQIKDVSEANVVCLYLFPEVNEKLKPMLQKTLKPGSRVVSHDFLMGDDWPPEKEVTIKSTDGNEHSIYLWTIPEPKKKK